jgi:hypothetical protein
MLDEVTLAPGDRVLFLTIPPPELIEGASAILSRGVIAAIGDRDPISNARRAAVHLENTMFTPATPDEIPWQDSFFSWVIDTAGGWSLDPAAAREIRRVLCPGGHVWLANLDISPLLTLGFVVVESGPAFHLLQKPADPASPHPNGALHVLR